MTKFSAGDTIVDRFGNMATVADTMESVSVEWHGLDNVMGCYPSELFKLVPRKFKEGQFARIVRGIDPEYDNEPVYIFEDDGSEEGDDPYGVVFINSDKGEVNFSADEMIPWVPLAGERVIEADNDPNGHEVDDEIGTVVGSSSNADGSDFKVKVLWPSFPLPQDWAVSDLEPEAEDDIAVGDTVEYVNPIFAGSYRGTVQGLEGNIIRVVFESGLQTGNYSKEFFTKAA